MRDASDLRLKMLVRLRRPAGGDVYDRGLLAAKAAVGSVILTEAERLAGAGANMDRESFEPFRRNPMS